MSSQDQNVTIAAIATPPGDGGVAIIRLSGPRSEEIVNSIFSKELHELEPYQLSYGSLSNEDGSLLDRVMVVVMRAPHSFTGEEVVEIHAHGGHFLSKKILNRVVQLGAEVAKPGEFTERAFLNGKMDLAQAEAVQSLIHAKNEYALKFASQQLEGGLSKKIQAMQDQLIEQAAILEAWVDFPEEGLEFTSLEELIQRLEEIQKSMLELIETYENGRVMQEGFSICLAGRPNVGKSSIMNQLLKKERAIVTSIAGTTRDTLEETLQIDGVSYKLIDTAGIRETQEVVEKIGIARAQDSVQKADLVLLVLDACDDLHKEDCELISLLKDQKTLVLWNKIDLKQAQEKSIPFENSLSLSAKTGEGIGLLFETIPKLLMGELNLTAEIHLTELRHKKALEEAHETLQKVIAALQNDISPEWTTFDLKSCLRSLSSIIGMDITENILSNIFSRFCIGK